MTLGRVRRQIWEQMSRGVVLDRQRRATGEHVKFRHTTARSVAREHRLRVIHSNHAMIASPIAQDLHRRWN